MLSNRAYSGLIRSINSGKIINNHRIKRETWNTIKCDRGLATSVSMGKTLEDNLSYIHNLGTEPLQYRNLGQCLEISANKWPERPFIVSNHESVSMTYSQMLEEADKLAAGLTESGLRPGDRIGICSPNSYRWIVTMMAAARAGFVMVAINFAYQPRELEYCLKKVGIKALLVPMSYKNQKYYNMLRNLMPELEKCRPGELLSDCLPNLRAVIMIDNSRLPGTFTYDNIIDMSSSGSRQMISKLQTIIQPDSGCNIQFTSGTTGNPKAACMSHFNFVNNGYYIGKRNELSEKHHVICTQVPLFHAFGLVVLTAAGMQYGSTFVLPSFSYSPEATLKAIHKHKCTVLGGTPTMFVDVLNKKRESGIKTDCLEIAVTGGAPCSPKLFQSIKKDLGVKKIKSVFGLTECSAVAFQSLSDESEEQVYETVGYVQDHLEVKVIDFEGKVVPFGTPGELCIRGYSTMLEYWEDKHKTEETIGPDGWLKTGDQFVLYKNGYGKVVGRLKDVIIRGGENIYPKEIEDFINTHPDVIESQVFGIADERLGEEVCVGVRVHNGAAFNMDVLQRYCSGKLASYKVPKHLKIVDTFPKTTSGKIQRFKLKQMVEQGNL